MKKQTTKKQLAKKQKPIFIQFTKTIVEYFTFSEWDSVEHCKQKIKDGLVKPQSFSDTTEFRVES